MGGRGPWPTRMRGKPGARRGRQSEAGGMRLRESLSLILEREAAEVALRRDACRQCLRSDPPHALSNPAHTRRQAMREALGLKAQAERLARLTGRQVAWARVAPASEARASRQCLSHVPQSGEAFQPRCGTKATVQVAARVAFHYSVAGPPYGLPATVARPRQSRAPTERPMRGPRRAEAAAPIGRSRVAPTDPEPWDLLGPGPANRRAPGQRVPRLYGDPALISRGRARPCLRYASAPRRGSWRRPCAGPA